MQFDPPPPPPQYNEEDFRYLRSIGTSSVLGPELLVNGHFEDGATGWTVSGEDGTHIITFANSTMRYQSDTTSPVLALSQLGLMTIGARYQLVVVTSSYTGGSLKSDAASPPVFGNVLGTATYTFTAVGSTFNVYRNSSNVDTTLDMLSLRRIL